MRRILCAAALAVGWATLSDCSGDTLTAGQMPGDDGGAGKATGSGSAGSSSTTGQAGSSTTTSNAGGAPGSGGEAGSPGAGGDGGKGGSTAGAGNAGKGGGAGKGGIGGAAGAGGGAAGSGGKTNDGGTDCFTMRANVEKLMAEALKCTPTSPTVPCTQEVQSFCCPIVVTDANAQATLDYLAALDPYKKMCPTPCPAIVCPNGPGVCMASSAGNSPTCVLNYP